MARAPLAARRVLAAHLRVLALEPGALRLTGLPNTALLAFHALALAAMARLAHWPFWAIPALWVGAGLALLVWRRGWPARGAEALAPLFGLYLVVVVRLFFIYGLHREVPPSLGYTGAVGLAAAWITFILLRGVHLLPAAALGAGALALWGWAGQLWRLAPAGVTGSDPYAYVQMAVDLVQHGTLRHSFPLAVLAEQLGLPTLPATHVGYVLPNAHGLAPTVWPPGYSVLLAAAYRLFGEPALLYSSVPVALAAATLTWALACQLLPPGSKQLSRAAAALAVFALATSAEMFLRLSIPLADGAALVFTALAVVATLAAARRGPAALLGRLAAWGALAGAAVGAAYAVRYTQVLIMPGLALAAWLGLRRPRPRLAFLIPFAAAAALVALPDVLYRVNLYGSPFRFGTGELALFSWQALPEALRRLAPEFLAPGEFGWLWPFALLGAACAYRRHRLALGALAAAYGPLFAFHIWYPFVRLRDLLALYAPLAALAGLGAVVAVVWLWRRRGAAWTVVRVTVVLVALLGAGWRLRLLQSWDSGYYTFGYLRPEQRAGLEHLAALTEPNAVIAASLNSGAVELYGGRPAVRPGHQLQPGASWTEAQWLTFAAALRAQGRPLYLLMDSAELDAPLAAVRAAYGVTAVAALNVPVYFVGGGSRNATVTLWRVNAAP
ncbi:MAG: hypothetical protein IT317_04715 [Anaerolineales bacterium]|nr:hypothetical protein [Anaerolineales bacterium]